MLCCELCCVVLCCELCCVVLCCVVLCCAVCCLGLLSCCVISTCVVSQYVSNCGGALRPDADWTSPNIGGLVLKGCNSGPHPCPKGHGHNLSIPLHQPFLMLPQPYRMPDAIPLQMYDMAKVSLWLFENDSPHAYGRILPLRVAECLRLVCACV